MNKPIDFYLSIKIILKVKLANNNDCDDQDCIEFFRFRIK